MTSETYVIGGPISEKFVIGSCVRQHATTLGDGHVEATVENRGNRITVSEARACPLTALDCDIREPLEAHLNR